MTANNRIPLSCETWMRDGKWALNIEGPDWIIAAISGSGASTLVMRSYGGTVGSGKCSATYEQASDDDDTEAEPAAEDAADLDMVIKQRDAARAHVAAKDKKIEELEADAALGRLVRNMPVARTLIHHSDEWEIIDCELDDDVCSIGKGLTPEDALRNGGVKP